MKKIILTILAVTMASVIVKADPAKKVNVTYKDGILKIEALHKVKDVSLHYIDLITITVDGKEYKVIKPKKQTSLASEVVEIPLPGKPKGTKIEVTTRCNEFGKKSGSLTL